tara:strand:+ start:3642 stop:4265 length:624 start_codon:yes stop_codon:yes gene_type:complete
MKRLRAPGGCPWDQEQTHQTLTESLIEETAELLEAIDNNDMPLMREELGDVLLQVVFHAELASEAGHFNFDDVAAEINEKLVRRHPHVFGDLDLKDSDAVLVNWEKIKAEEKKGKPAQATRLKPLPPRLSSLLFASDTYKHICREKLDTHLPDGLAESAEGTSDITEDELGEALFSMAAAAQSAKLDPEASLRRYTLKLRQQIEDAQ